MKPKWHQPHPPDPGKNVAKFLGYLCKLGGVWTLEECEEYCQEIGERLDNIIESFGNDLISYGKIRGEQVVYIIDYSWACGWAKYHGVSWPHHGQQN